MLKTEELERQINEKYLLIKDNIDEEIWFDISKIISFKKADINSITGMYVYSDDIGYHVEYIGDRGAIEEKLVTTNINKFYFEVIWDIVVPMSISYAHRNKIKGRDWRRIIFECSLNLLKIIDEEYYIKGKERIDKILEEAPYDDSLF